MGRLICLEHAVEHAGTPVSIIWPLSVRAAAWVCNAAARISSRLQTRSYARSAAKLDDDLMSCMGWCVGGLIGGWILGRVRSVAFPPGYPREMCRDRDEGLGMLPRCGLLTSVITTSSPLVQRHS